MVKAMLEQIQLTARTACISMDFIIQYYMIKGGTISIALYRQDNNTQWIFCVG